MGYHPKSTTRTMQVEFHYEKGDIISAALAQLENMRKPARRKIAEMSDGWYLGVLEAAFLSHGYKLSAMKFRDFELAKDLPDGVLAALKLRAAEVFRRAPLKDIEV